MVFITCLKILKLILEEKIKLYSQNFLSSVENGEILKVEIQGNNIKGVYSNGKNFTTYSPNDPNLIEKLSDKGVIFQLHQLMKKCHHCLVFYFLVSNVTFNRCLDFFHETNARCKGGAMGFGRSKAKMMNELKGKVTFNDVAGVEEAKEEVEEIVEFLKDPKNLVDLEEKFRGSFISRTSWNR